MKIALLDKNKIRKLPTGIHNHMTHVVKTDILTGHEEIGILHFILDIIFLCKFITYPCIFSKLAQL